MASIDPTGYNSDVSEEEAISTFVKEGESKNSGSGGNRTYVYQEVPPGQLTVTKEKSLTKENYMEDKF